MTPGAGHVEQQEADAVVLRARSGRCAPGRTSSRPGRRSEVQIFWPLTTKWSPSSSARVCSDARSRAGVGLGVALAPADLAAGDRRQVLALLLLGAELQQRRARSSRCRSRPAAAAAAARASPAQHPGLVGARARRRRTRAATSARSSRARPCASSHALRVGLELDSCARPSRCRPRCASAGASRRGSSIRARRAPRCENSR